MSVEVRCIAPTDIEKRSQNSYTCPIFIPAWSGAQIGGIRVFSTIEITVIHQVHLYCGLSVKVSTSETPHAEVVDANQNTPVGAPWLMTPLHGEVLGSPVYICGSTKDWTMAGLCISKGDLSWYRMTLHYRSWRLHKLNRFLTQFKLRLSICTVSAEIGCVAPKTVPWQVGGSQLIQDDTALVRSWRLHKLNKFLTQFKLRFSSIWTVSAVIGCVAPKTGLQQVFVLFNGLSVNTRLRFLLWRLVLFLGMVLLKFTWEAL